ncbi:Phosphate uptake regulator PhoU (PhoU) (PDB:1T8B) [Commensalibacter communis]|uniref:Phosphate-specific transport system accessory protein PhoU n=1 Tax=Commensalibacter communis TaxID=2972786 RepID=A0A9W4TPQ4_9PROT|nr:phosphate signaling complex protein PhoU [Commensalibacter communis]CAI3954087.1 Phosphate uptake regulator PhoU (PhoU) (PDB:1T8B) [Commensalibacter communis]CAI3956089.1 Phosphate uptake regulator PhoU (PhoU) (PDB:1T8B) [Commensalibacter communis]CAI3956246.1 Phosphate uptake regulator PhoU (PhoU) (PDB:1T8B) [Commensalibacter communis]CAI3956478.1 Phosphate uptake regulator PhoU (PhoU) (PDB:1T8B) [Commensalibacter communis]CAI3956994.1 Phosphate uptake regulator PhoU (PhoU) (PDB:1T8B) [Com
MVDKLPEHTVSRYEQELEQLRSMILRMFGMVENQLTQTLVVLRDRKIDTAYEIALHDIEIDAYEKMVSAFSIQILALRSPMAIDLREIVSAFKVCVDLERIGDLIAGMCRRIVQIKTINENIPLSGLLTMGRQVQENLRQVVIAITTQDQKLMLHLWNADDIVDDLYLSVFTELTNLMEKDSQYIWVCSHLLFMVKNLERIGDHITNIIESYYYVFTGDTLPYQRVGPVDVIEDTIES